MSWSFVRKINSGPLHPQPLFQAHHRRPLRPNAALELWVPWVFRFRGVAVLDGSGEAACTRECQALCQELCHPLYPFLRLLSAFAEDPEGSVVRAVANSLLNAERVKPGSCEVLVRSLLQQLASSKASSLKDLQELAARSFTKSKTTAEMQNANSETDGIVLVLCPSGIYFLAANM